MKYFDNSMLQAYNKCPAFFYWRYVLHLIPINSFPIALEFGEAIHRALKSLYLGKSLDSAILIFEDYFKKYEGQDNKRTLQLGKDILKAYYKQYFPECFKVLLIEQLIEVPLSDNIIFVGRLDLAVKMDDGIYIYDHKTSSMMFASFVTNPNHQFTGYIWGTEKQYKLKIKGAMLNLLGVFKTKQDFLRKPIWRTKQDISEWKCWFLTTVKQIKTALKATEIINCDPLIWFSKRPNNCFNYFRICMYNNLCTCSDKCIRKRLIEGLFKQEPWQPWLRK